MNQTRYKIYLQLIKRKIPDCLAALIAIRIAQYYLHRTLEILESKTSAHNGRVAKAVKFGFTWGHTVEGYEFWSELREELEDLNL